MVAENRVRARREASGLSQAALAQASGLSRQSVGAIEAGRTTPAVDVAIRIAGVLGCSVEDLFGGVPPAEALVTEGSCRASERVILARMGDRWIAHALPRGDLRATDGVVLEVRGNRVEVEPTRPLSSVRDNLLVMGCAEGLAVLMERLNGRTDQGRFVWLPGSSTTALEELSNGRVHVAGVHLVDQRTGEPNVPDVRRVAGQRSVSLITLARWEVGLVFPAGKVRSVEDLTHPELRLVRREKGAGARRLLDQTLASMGSRGGERRILEVNSHGDVARAIALGAGDLGIASRDVALALGTGFVPLVEERYDLAVPTESLQDVRIQRLFDALTTSGVRRELSSLGYDVRNSGDHVGDVRV